MKHSLMAAVLAAFGFVLVPAAALAQATDQPATTTTTAPYATATANPMESPGTMETATTPPSEEAPAPHRRGSPWGLIGLIGLLGLLGLRGGSRSTATTTREL